MEVSEGMGVNALESPLQYFLGGRWIGAAFCARPNLDPLPPSLRSGGSFIPFPSFLSLPFPLTRNSKLKTRVPDA